MIVLSLFIIACCILISSYFALKLRESMIAILIVLTGLVFQFGCFWYVLWLHVRTQ